MIFEYKCETGNILVKNGEISLPVSVKCPMFKIEGMEVNAGMPVESENCDLDSGKLYKAVYSPVALDKASKLEVELYLQWYPEESLLRKWAAFRLDSSSRPAVLEEVVLEILKEKNIGAIEFYPVETQSCPVFFNGFFAGIEFPVASTRLEDGKLLLAHRPGIRVESGIWYETRKAVFGLAADGREKDAFFKYLAKHTITTEGFHVNYNSWWTSPVPYSENNILELMKVFKEQLYDKYGVLFDTFCIDMGWSAPHAIWEINSELFPEGFKRLMEMAASMGSSLGLWISPTNCYHPHSFDNDWARGKGYEVSEIPWANNTKLKYACLGGQNYSKAFHDRIVELVEDYDIKHIKFDGCVLECEEADHGHEPGASSSEAIAESIIHAFTDIRKAMPDIWMETTCFGWNPSPWWLFYVNSTIGTYGDDAPHGRVPCPIFRESYTTARDYFNLQGTGRIPIPARSQEVLGLIHQTPDDFMNDAVITVMRGHMFLPVYLNPEFMNEQRWKAFADVLKWARTNAGIIKNTEPFLPSLWLNGKAPRFTNDSFMPRESYGYTHWKADGGLVALRNPWIAPCVHRMVMPEFPDYIHGEVELKIVSIYPEVRLYRKGVRLGETVDIPLAPYETLVLSIDADQPVEGVTGVDNVIKKYIKTGPVNFYTTCSPKLREAKAVDAGNTNHEEDECGYINLKMAVDVENSAPRAEILVLLEGKTMVQKPEYRIEIEGKKVEATFSGTDGSWVHSTIHGVENWLFLRIPTTESRFRITMDLLADSSIDKASVWIWGTKPGQLSAGYYPNALPQPELISLDAVLLAKYTNE